MRRTLMAGVVAAALIGVTGCGADEPRPRIAEPTASPTETPPTTSESEPPPDLEQPPAIPPAAANATTEGAIAFTEYFWELATYAQKTGDVAGLKGLVAKSCDTCQGAIEAIEESTRGRREVSGGDITVVDAEAQMFSPSSGQTGAAVQFTTKNKAQTVRLNGEVVQRFTAATLRSRFLLLHTASKWRVDIWRIEEQ